jgi:hypothetical protein
MAPTIPCWNWATCSSMRVLGSRVSVSAYLHAACRRCSEKSARQEKPAPGMAGHECVCPVANRWRQPRFFGCRAGGGEISGCL